MVDYVPDGGDALDRLAAELASVFADAERRLSAALALQVKAGLETDPDNVVRAIDLAALRRDADAISAALRNLTPGEVARIIGLARAEGASAALSELSVVAGVPDPTIAQRLGPTTDLAAEIVDGVARVSVNAPVIVGTLSSVPALVALTADLTSAVDDAARRILRWPDDVYRRAVARSAADVLLGTATNRVAQVRAWQDLVSRGVTGFRDSANREWNLATYVETATRTATRRAWEVQHTDSYRRAGVELVEIVVGSGACKACTDVAGEVWRVDAGPTGRLELDSVTGEGKVVVNVAGTLDDARAHGWRHPNCRCRPVAYLAGLPTVGEVTTYDPRAEADRARLRDLERRTRASRLRVDTALTDVEAERARARTRSLQQQIREHVAETGLLRQRNRERVNLSNGDLPGGGSSSGSSTAPRPTAPIGPAAITASEGQTLADAAIKRVKGEVTAAEYNALVEEVRAQARTRAS